MILDEPYNSWLVKHVAANMDSSIRFVLKVTADTSNGEIPVVVNLDLVWFVLIQVDDDPKTKLEIALLLLKKPEYLAAFKATQEITDAKRIIEEFLIFNYYFLNGLKEYINFSILNVPIDFISHTLFMKHPNQTDIALVDEEQIKIITAVMDSGFVLSGDYPHQSVGMAIHKVLLMDSIPQRFIVAKRLLDLGFKLFGENNLNNAETAITLINNRNNDSNCMAIIKSHVDQFKIITLKVPGSISSSNLADYYYWVKEDMSAVQFIRDAIGIDFTR